MARRYQIESCSACKVFGHSAAGLRGPSETAEMSCVSKHDSGTEKKHEWARSKLGLAWLVARRTWRRSLSLPSASLLRCAQASTRLQRFAVSASPKLRLCRRAYSKQVVHRLARSTLGSYRVSYVAEASTLVTLSSFRSGQPLDVVCMLATVRCIIGLSVVVLNVTQSLR